MCWRPSTTGVQKTGKQNDVDSPFRVSKSVVKGQAGETQLTHAASLSVSLRSSRQAPRKWSERKVDSPGVEELRIRPEFEDEIEDDAVPKARSVRN